MNARLVRGIIGWNLVLTVMLLVSAAANVASVQASNDPPVRVFNSTADKVGGVSAAVTDDVTIGSTSSTEIAEVQVSLPASKPHMCIGFASAEVENQNGSGVYEFNFVKTGIGPSGSARRIELNDNPGINDPTYFEVTTLNGWTELTGIHHFRFLGRKTAAGAADTVVTNATVAVICVKKSWN